MSDQNVERDDIAPGLLDSPDLREAVQSYVTGFVLASLITAASFYVLYTHLIWGPGIPVALAVLAVAQIGVHLVFFMHITTAPDNTNNVLALAFGVLIVVLIIGGSLWIMSHLNDRLMPMHQMSEIRGQISDIRYQMTENLSDL
jgi:cytochrome o ubiquinol oxidase operon protein cyoD